MTLTQALAKLQAAGRIKSPWLPGMRVRWRSRAGFTPWEREPNGWAGTGFAAAEVDLMDPATIGCLTALLREATGAVVTAEYHRDGWADALGPSEWWTVVNGATGTVLALRATEGEALAAAIIALAETL